MYHFFLCINDLMAIKCSDQSTSNVGAKASYIFYTCTLDVKIAIDMAVQSLVSQTKVLNEINGPRERRSSCRLHKKIESPHGVKHPPQKVHARAEPGFLIGEGANPKWEGTKIRFCPDFPNTA